MKTETVAEEFAEKVVETRAGSKEQLLARQRSIVGEKSYGTGIDTQ